MGKTRYLSNPKRPDGASFVRTQRGTSGESCQRATGDFAQVQADPGIDPGSRPHQATVHRIEVGRATAAGSRLNPAGYLFEPDEVVSKITMYIAAMVKIMTK